MPDPFMRAAIAEAREGLRTGGIPRVVVGENTTFLGAEALLRARGVAVEVLQDAECMAMMRDFIARHPALWNEDIGV